MKTAALVLALCLAVAYAAYETYDFPLIVVDYLGGHKALTCEDYDIPENSTAEFWILPNFENTNGTWSKDNVFVSGDQMTLNITNIQQSDLGTYFCVVTTPTDETYMQKYGLNLKGPYFEDLSEKYDTNIIIAFSAMISFVLSAVYIWVVYKFSYYKRIAVRIEPDDYEMGAFDTKLPGGVKGSVGFSASNGNVKEDHEDNVGEKNEAFEKEESARL